MDQFYIILPTSGPKNLSNFSTQLPVDINLSGTWEVGLSEISLTKSWNTLIESQFLELLSYDGNDLANDYIKVDHIDNATILSGYYTKAELVDKINQVISLYIKIDYPKEMFNKFVVKKRPQAVIENNKIALKPGILKNNELLIIRPQIKLCQAIGIDYSSIMEQTKNLFLDYSKYYAQPEKAVELFKEPVMFTSKPIDMEMIKSFNVYSDVCIPRIIGKQLKQLLRIVHLPEHKSFGEQLTINYETPQYSRLNSNQFNKVLINIKESLKHSEGEELDNFIPFQFGEIVITLHFRQISDLELESSFATSDVSSLDNPLSKLNPLDVDIKPDDTILVAQKRDL